MKQLNFQNLNSKYNTYVMINVKMFEQAKINFAVCHK